MNEEKGIPRRMADDNNTTGGMVVDTTDAISLIFMREVDLLNGFSQSDIPELESMVLSQSNKHVSQGASPRIRACFVNKENRGWPGLFCWGRSRERQQRGLDRHARNMRSCSIGLFNELANIPEPKSSGFVKGDNSAVILAESEVFASLSC